MTQEPDDRATFTRTGMGGTLQGVVSVGGALGFGVVAVAILGVGFPGALLALLPAFFAVLLAAGAMTAFIRGDDPIVETAPHGVWLPGLGWAGWKDFADIRLEHATGPAGSSGTRTYRRLGFVPRRGHAVDERHVAERLAFGLTATFYRFSSILLGNRSIEFAPFGVQEVEIGSPEFERLLMIVGRHVTVGTERERRLDEDGPPIPMSGPAARGLWETMGPAVEAASIGFLAAAIAGAVAPDPGDRAQRPELLAGLLGMLSVGFCLRLIRDVRGARSRGARIRPLAAIVVAAAMGGAVVAMVMGFGPS